MKLLISCIVTLFICQSVCDIEGQICGKDYNVYACILFRFSLGSQVSATAN